MDKGHVGGNSKQKAVTLLLYARRGCRGMLARKLCSRDSLNSQRREGKCQVVEIANPLCVGDTQALLSGQFEFPTQRRKVPSRRNRKPFLRFFRASTAAASSVFQMLVHRRLLLPLARLAC